MTALALAACGASADGPPANPYDPDIHGLGYDACEINHRTPTINSRYVRDFNALGDLTVEIKSQSDHLGDYRRTIAYANRHVSSDGFTDVNNQLYQTFNYRRDAQGWLTDSEGYILGPIPAHWKLTWHLDARGAPVQIDHDDNADGVIEPEHVERFTQDTAGCIATREYATSTGRARAITTAPSRLCTAAGRHRLRARWHDRSVDDVHVRRRGAPAPDQRRRRVRV